MAQSQFSRGSCATVPKVLRSMRRRAETLDPPSPASPHRRHCFSGRSSAPGAFTAANRIDQALKQLDERLRGERVLFPSVKDPLGKRTLLQAGDHGLHARQGCRLCLLSTLSLYFLSFLEGAHRRDGEPREAEMPRSGVLVVSSPSQRQSGAVRRFAAIGEKFDVVVARARKGRRRIVVGSRDARLPSRDHEVQPRLEAVESGDPEVHTRRESVESRDRGVLVRQERVESCDRELLTRQERVESRDHELLTRQERVESCDREVVERQERVESGDHELLTRHAARGIELIGELLKEEVRRSRSVLATPAFRGDGDGKKRRQR